MNTKLTLRLDNRLIDRAKHAAAKRGKSVSQMVSEFFDSLEGGDQATPAYPPITSALLGSLRGKSLSKDDYHRHLRDKYL
ncbi:MAG: antitoxin [Verrucomicrobia bacterium]|nr:antitoxin [Verrucomicrobiota bacterium]